MNASGRRQRQAANGFAHLAPRQRPGYKLRDAATSRRRLEAQMATERRMSQGKKKQKGAATNRFTFVIFVIAVAVYAFATYELVTVRCTRASFQPTVEQAGGQGWAFVETKSGGHRGGKKH